MSALRKAVTASALVLTLSAAVPAHLRAAEREAPATQHAATAGWFSALWHQLAALFGADTTPPPPAKPVGGPTTDSGCSWDPWGGCGG
jgi:hypothetical protein